MNMTNKMVLQKMIAIRQEILKAYDYDSDRAKKHVGYKGICELEEELALEIRQEEDQKIIDNSFVLLDYQENN